MKFINVLFLFFIVFHSGTIQLCTSESYKNSEQEPPQGNSREEAFAVLRNKCNTCHATKKRTEVFTKVNMEELAAEIYEQVFVKKKMPKGRKTTLTEKETQILENWIQSVLGERSISKPKKGR